MRAVAEATVNVPGNRLELNARMAASLDAPVLMVLDANSASGVSDLVNKALASRNAIQEERAEVLGLIVNKARFLRGLPSHTLARSTSPCFVTCLGWQRIDCLAQGKGLPCRNEGGGFVVVYAWQGCGAEASDNLAQVPVRERGLYKAQLEKELEGHALPLLGVLPFNPLISSVRLDEIQAALNVDMISGRKHHADLTVNQVRSLETSVLAKQPVYACMMDMCALLRAAYRDGPRQAWWMKQEAVVAAGVYGHSRFGKHTGQALRPGQHKTPGAYHSFVRFQISASSGTSERWLKPNEALQLYCGCCDV